MSDSIECTIDSLKKIDSEDMTNEIFMVNLINNYTDYYKKIKKKSINFTLFDGINLADPTSTNAALEEFYEKLIEYKTFQKHNPEYIKIYNSTHDISSSDNEIYGLLINGILKYKSISLFALLIELTNLQYEKIKSNIYNIILLN
jgi:hypothetical protein